MEVFKVWSTVSYVFGGFLNSVISVGLKYVPSSENLQGSRNLGSSKSVSTPLLQPQF